MSSAQIGNLNVKLGLDTAEFSAGAKRAQSTLSGLTGSIKSFGAGIVGALSVGALASAVDDVIHRVAEIGDVAESIGITAEQLQVYNRMALASGTSSEVMAKGLQTVAEQSTDASSALSKLFAANGLSTQGMTVNEVIRQFMTLLQNARTPADQLAMATSVLGARVGRELVEAFRAGAAGVDKSTKAMVKSGNYFSNAEIQRLQDIETRYNEVTANIATAWQRMVVKMVEGANNVVQALDPILHPDFSKPTAGGELWRYLTGQGTDPNFGTDPVVFKPQVVNSGMGSLGGPNEFNNPPVAVKVTVLPPPKPKTDAVKKKITQEVTPDPIKPQVTPISIEDIRGPAVELQSFNDTMQQSTSIADELSSTLTDGLVSSLVDIAFNAHSAGDALDMLKRTALNALQAISTQLLRSALSGLFSGIGGGQFGGVLSGVLGGLFGGARAGGGPVAAGRSYLVGEKGPELFTPKASGSITPNNQLASRSGGNVTVNIQTQDVASFQRSQTQVASMITRAVARGQRNM